MTSDDYRRILNNERDALELSPEDFDNTLMHFAKLYHQEQMRSLQSSEKQNQEQKDNSQ